MKKFSVLMVLLTNVLWSQNESTKESDNLLFEGNQQMIAKSYADAETPYRKAAALNAQGATNQYNMGNALYKSEHSAEAFNQYKKAIALSTDKASKHRAFHNMGNVFMKSQEYEKAVEAYKNALRNFSQDPETRYNYALAKALLKKQQQEQKNQDQNKDDKKDQKDQKDKGDQKEDPNQDKESDKGDPKDDQNDKGKPEKEENKNQQPKPGQMSPQQIKNLLEAMNNEEKKVQDKVNEKKVKGIPVKAKKDW